MADEVSDSARTCPGCGEPGPPAARFCWSCGRRLDESRETGAEATAGEASSLDGYAAEFDSRDATKLARELFERHVELLRRHRSEVRRLRRQADSASERLDALARRPSDPETAEGVQALLEELEELGEGWEEVQHAYNADSELLDEEILDRMSELEVDVELPPSLQETLDEEIAGMSGDLASLEESIREAGARGNLLIHRARGGFFGKTRAPGVGWGAVAVLFVAAGLVAALARWRGLPWSDAALVAAPLVIPFLGIILSIFSRRT